MKERKQCPHSCQYWHQLVQLMLKNKERRQLSQLPILQNDRYVFQTQHRQVAGDAERYLSQHRVRIRMPERKPESQRLSNIDPQNSHRTAVADEPNHNRSIEDGLEFCPLQNVDEKSREERSRPECDDSQIKKNPK